jgi:hypothetical protein
VTEVQELLDAYVPLRSDEEPDWSDVVHRAKPRRGALRRRTLVPVLVVVGLFVGGVAIAAALDAIPWWETAPPPVNPEFVQLNEKLPTSIERSKARTVAVGEDGAALIAAPIRGGGFCLFLYLPGELRPGPSCVYGASGDDEIRGYEASSGEPRWILYGRIMNPDAASIHLTPGGNAPFRIPLHHGGFFLANVPRARWDALSNATGVGKTLDHSGAVMRTACVSWGPGPLRSHDEGEGFAWSYDSRASSSRCHAEQRPQLAGYEAADFAAAKKLVQLTLTASYSVWPAGATIATWKAPTPGGLCVFTARAAPRPATRKDAGGGFCIPVTNEADAFEGSFNIQLGAAGPNVFRWLLSGSVDPKSGIERVELHSGEGNVRIAFAHDHFLAELPHTSNGDEFPPGGPYMLVGYDTDGNEVAHVNLEEAHERSEPPR